MRSFLLGLITLLSIVPATAGDRGEPFQNLDQMIEVLNLRPYFKENKKAKHSLKIAVFDNGFKGAEEEIGRSLPAFTEIHPGPVKLPGEEETHGFYMAKILWSLLTLGGTDERYAPAEFHLYNTYGYSNFAAAVQDAIDRDIDIVLYSQTWEYGGNFDGQGFINVLVSEAVDSGILWINNSGNFAQTTFNAAVETGDDDWVELPGRNKSVEVRCEKAPKKSKAKTCTLRAVLSWNSFSNDVEEGTDKDLDFVLTDDTLNVIQSSSLIQKKEPGDQPGTSKYPREILTAEVKPGLYYLRVKNRSQNFDEEDRLRITASGDFITMSNFDKQENLLPPADNKKVITVGAMDSEKSSISRNRKKPELLTNSLVSITEEENFKGSSNSAAMVAAGAAILFSLDPSLTREEFIQKTGNQGGGGNGTPGMGLPLEHLGFQPTDPTGCFRPVTSTQLPAHLQWAVTQGGTLVETNAGQKVFYPFDPIRLFSGMFRRFPNDILVISPQGPGLFHRSMLWNLHPSLTEMVQTPYGRVICSDKSSGNVPSWAKVFRLPSDF